MSLCDFTNLVDERMARIATQYRESPNLRALIETYIDTLVAPANAICEMTVFDIDTATGSSLTIIGNAMGWPRIHVAGQRPLVFGFECPDDCFNNAAYIGGFCDSWDCDTTPAYSSFEFTDDELYRGFLKSLVIRYDNDFSRTAVVEAAQALFGDGAGLLTETNGVVNVFTGRQVTTVERSIAHLYAQVVPVAHGVGFGLYETTNGSPFGFGDGWGEFCTSEFASLTY